MKNPKNESNRDKGRVNQRYRTRRELLQAASRLLREGKTPTMADIADEALVSRATAYRYFPNRESLLAEAPLDGKAPTAEELFMGNDHSSVADRVDKAEEALHKMTFENEIQIRTFLALSLAPNDSDSSSNGDPPRRQNRRMPLIEAALAPERSRLEDRLYTTLCQALAVYFGGEAMVVFRDVLGVSPEEAREVKKWAIRTLVNAALEDSRQETGQRQS